jgi:hypothetical protein
MSINKQIKIILSRNETILNERTGDKQQRVEAEKLLSLIKKYLNQKSYKVQKYNNKNSTVKIPLNDIGLNLDLAFSYKPNNPEYAAFGISDTTGNKVIEINVGCVDNPGLKKLFDLGLYEDIVIDGSLSLTHELIHYLDSIRTADGYRLGKKTDYYNSPSEFNAFYQEVASKYDGIIENIKKSEQTKEKRIHRFYKDVAESPNELIRKIFDDNPFYNNYNKEYKFKLIKRIYQLFYELISEL